MVWIMRGVEAGRRRTHRVKDYGGVLPPWFGKIWGRAARKTGQSGKGKRRKNNWGTHQGGGGGAIVIAKAILHRGEAVKG